MHGGSSPLGNSLEQRVFVYSPYQGTNIRTDLSAYMLEIEDEADWHLFFLKWEKPSALLTGIYFVHRMRNLEP